MKVGGRIIKKIIGTFFAATMFAVLLSMAFLPACQATAGVNVGDWFRYRGTVVLWQADPGVPFPPHQFANILLEYNQTDWYRYTVTGISGDVVTFQVVTHWKNGTETTTTLDDNMTSSFTMMVIGANLTAGTKIRDAYDWSSFFGFPYVWPERYLNQSIMVPFNGQMREVNVLDWVHPPIFGPPTTRQIYWWDKVTGIQVRYEVSENGTDFASGGSYRYVAVFELIDTSKGWGAVILENLNIGVVVLGSAVALIVGKRLYRKQLRCKSL